MKRDFINYGKALYTEDTDVHTSCHSFIFTEFRKLA